MLSDKKITINAKTAIDGVDIATYGALLDVSTNDVSFYMKRVDKDACKEHREIVRADEAEFEDFVYSLQDMLAE